MSRFPLKFLTVALLAGAVLSACDDSQARTQRALEAYQSAAASGDLIATRDALSRLVAADEDVADYWTALGQVQLQLGAYPQAFNSFSRALELNRSSPDLLRVLAQIALHSDRLDLAEDYARQLDLVDPGDEAVLMTRGLVALRQGNLDEAMGQAQAILKNDPTDNDANLLQSQVLLRQGKLDQAIAALEKQVRAKPTDVGSFRSLASFYEEKGDIARVAELRRKVWSFRPDDPTLGLQSIEASLRARDYGWARQASLKLLTPQASLPTVKSVLEAWEDFWPGPERVRLAQQLAAGAPNEQRTAYASFLNHVGAPAQAYAIAEPMTRDGVDASSVQAAAAVAVSLARLGKAAEAQRWIGKVLAVDDDNVDAFRARAMLELGRGRNQAAINDALKIVTLVPASPDDRLLLYRSYMANGDRDEAGRVLWQAFHDLPAERHVYTALQQYLTTIGDRDSMRRVEEEYADQRQDENLKELI